MPSNNQRHCSPNTLTLAKQGNALGGGRLTGALTHGGSGPHHVPNIIGGMIVARGVSQSWRRSACRAVGIRLRRSMSVFAGSVTMGADASVLAYEKGLPDLVFRVFGGDGFYNPPLISVLVNGYVERRWVQMVHGIFPLDFVLVVMTRRPRFDSRQLTSSAVRNLPASRGTVTARFGPTTLLAIISFNAEPTLTLVKLGQAQVRPPHDDGPHGCEPESIRRREGVAALSSE